MLPVAARPGARRLLRPDGSTLIARLETATGFVQRFRGLLGRERIDADEALLFPKTTSLHMIGMRFPIAVLWLAPAGADGYTEVLGTALLQPWRGIGIAPRGTDAALEGHPDLLRTVRIGDRLRAVD